MGITMELQDKAWAVLPKEFREEVREVYDEHLRNQGEFGIIVCELESIFGEHNLSFDVEPKEMLCVKRADVMEKYALNEDILKHELTPHPVNGVRIAPQDLHGRKNGCCNYYNIGLDGKADKDGCVMLFPSRALYEKNPLDAKAAWAEWQEGQKPKIELLVSYTIRNGVVNGCGDFEPLKFKSEEEARQAAFPSRNTVFCQGLPLRCDQSLSRVADTRQ